MRAQWIQRIVFQGDRHALFADEDLIAHTAQFGERGIEADHVDPVGLQARVVCHSASSSPVSSR